MFFLNSSCDVSLSGFYVSTCETPAVFHQVKAADSLFCFTLDDVISVTLTHTHCFTISNFSEHVSDVISQTAPSWAEHRTAAGQNVNEVSYLLTDQTDTQHLHDDERLLILSLNIKLIKLSVRTLLITAQCFSVSVFSLSSPLIEQNSLSKSIFSTMFLGFTLSSWLKMKICPSSFSVQPNLFIQTFTCVSARTRTDDRRKLHLHKQLQSGIK